MENSSKPIKISWQAPENSHRAPKGNDWFWGLGVVAVGAIVLAFYFGNILFGIIILLFTITASLMVNQKSEMHDFQISRKGVRIGTMLYPFSNLESFWVEDTDTDDVILFRTKKSLQDILVVPFDSTRTDPEMIRDYLLDYLDEEELEEPFHHKLMEFFGF